EGSPIGLPSGWYQRREARPQNSSRMANCIWRMVEPAARPVIRPWFSQSMHPSGWPSLTLLKKLKTSHRNCPLNLSEKLRLLIMEKSVLKYDGPRTELRGALAKGLGSGRRRG